MGDSAWLVGSGDRAIPFPTLCLAGTPAALHTHARTRARENSPLQQFVSALLVSSCHCTQADPMDLLLDFEEGDSVSELGSKLWGNSPDRAAILNEPQNKQVS